MNLSLTKNQNMKIKKIIPMTMRMIPPLGRLPALKEGDKPRTPLSPLPPQPSPIPSPPPQPPPPLTNLVSMAFMLSTFTINNVIIFLPILLDLQVFWHLITSPHWVPSVSIYLIASILYRFLYNHWYNLNRTFCSLFYTISYIRICVFRYHFVYTNWCVIFAIYE